MYIFRRAITVKPDRYLQASQFAVEIASKIKQITGTEVSVFDTRFGAPMGTLLWTVRVDSFADLDTFRGKLLADPGYLELLATGSENFATLPEDAMMNIVSSNFGASPKRYYSSTIATPANGHITEVMTFGVSTQTYLAEHGFTTAFGASVFGAYGSVGWLVGADTMADVDAFQAFLTTDPKFGPMVDASGGLFVPASGLNTLVERIN